MNAIIPIPKIPISVRPGTMDDLPFIDGLQKIHTKQVGWMPTKALVGKIKAGHVLVAEEKANDEVGTMNDERKCEMQFVDSSSTSSFIVPRSSFPPVGYLIGNDQYFKRDDVGIIYQMNVTPERRRSLVGATLLKAMFDRAAYGCRLFCCWCAQDIEANRFWEQLGFVPLAFRSGSREKDRVHIFWQKRIRQEDVTTPYWFPAKTSSGSIREDRIVLPIPPGMNWWDEMPRVLPDVARASCTCLPEPKRKSTGKMPVVRMAGMGMGRLQFAQAKTKAKRTEPSQKMKNDPQHVAAARELRDRWLEQVNADPSALVGTGKYDVTRALLAPTAPAMASTAELLLPDQTSNPSIAA